MSVKIGFWKVTKQRAGGLKTYWGFGLQWDDGHTLHYSVEYHSYVGSLYKAIKHYRNEVKRIESLKI
jgi:molybdopterin synthase catalytic subunit